MAQDGGGKGGYLSNSLKRIKYFRAYFFAKATIQHRRVKTHELVKDHLQISSLGI